MAKAKQLTLDLLTQTVDEVLTANPGALLLEWMALLVERLSGQDERPVIDPRIRRIVRQRTDGHCFYCYSELRPGWHVDHFMPRSKGGQDSLTNFVASCPACNFRKNDKQPTRKQSLRFFAMLYAEDERKVDAKQFWASASRIWAEEDAKGTEQAVF